jgi:hypothetical protein
VERVKVKNLADAQASMTFASFTKSMTISDLAAMPPRQKSVLLAHNDMRLPEEHFRVEVPALIMGYKLEADEDYHVVIADPDNRKVTMVAEIPSASCIMIDLRDQMQGLRDTFDEKVGKPTAKYKKLPHGIAVTVEGILFRDFLHGQTGVAPSGTEIHPILTLTFDKPKVPEGTVVARR